jgi:hypothetical protein
MKIKECSMLLFKLHQDPPWNEPIKLLKNCKKIAEGIDGVKSVSSLAGYEILTGTGANSGTCFD